MSDLVMKMNYTLAIEGTTNVYQCDSSFLAFNDANTIALVHLPMLKDVSKIKLFREQWLYKAYLLEKSLNIS